MIKKYNSIPADAELKREWIKYNLKVKGVTLSDLARVHNITRQTLSLALKRPYPRWEFVIAQALELNPSELWPERYDLNNLPITKRNKKEMP